MTTAALNAIATAVDAYKAIFVSGPVAGVLSRPNPVRRSGFDLDVVVDRVEPLAEGVVALTLRAPDLAELPAWRPGSHIDVFLPSGLQRQYSLCGDPRSRFTYRIAVRRIDGGAGSTEIHDTARPGDRLRIRGPRNAFTFVDAPSYLFVAGGIGITPILPMVRAAGSRGRLVYTGRSRATMPFLDELPDATVLPDDEYGSPDIAELLALAAPGAAVYVCGPPPMIDAARVHMFGRNPTGSLHTERFSAPPVVDERPFDVTLARSGTTIRVGSDETLLTALGRSRNVDYSCRQGFCGTCKVPVLAGNVEHRGRVVPDDAMLACVSRVVDGSHLVLDI